MPMLVAIACLARRRRRMPCRGGGDTAAALELEQRHQYGPGSDQRHRWRDEPAPSGLHGLSSSPPLDRPTPAARARACCFQHQQAGSARRRVPRDGGAPAAGKARGSAGRRCQTAVPALTEQAPTPEARSQPWPGFSASETRVGAEGTAGAQSSEAASSSVLCAVCLGEARRWRGEAAEGATTLPCSHSYRPGRALPWLAAVRGACPCCSRASATVPSPEN